MDRLGPWPFRVVWTTLPLTAGPLFADALDPTRSGFRTTVSLGLWIVWAAVTVASFVPRMETLTGVRTAALVAVPAAAWALLSLVSADSEVRVIHAVGVAACLAAVFLVLLPELGQTFVDGSSYGDETRLPLRPPGALLLGPLPLTWGVVVAGLVGPILLLADQRWILGAVTFAIGAPLAAFGARSLHTLSKRWLVFVPAGMVLHDRMSLAEPALFPRNQIGRLTAAPADSRALDLTIGASGLLLELTLKNPIEVGLAKRQGTKDAEADVLAIPALLLAPTRPGAVLAEAARRNIAT